MIAAVNSVPTEIVRISPMITSMMLGGIRMPRQPPAVMTPAELVAAQQEVLKIHASEALLDYLTTRLFGGGVGQGRNIR